MCCEEYSTESSSIIELSAYSREFEKRNQIGIYVGEDNFFKFNFTIIIFQKDLSYLNKK